MRPPIIDCGKCGIPAYVGSDGIRCACTGKWSAEERLMMAAGHPTPEPLVDPDRGNRRVA